MTAKVRDIKLHHEEWTPEAIALRDMRAKISGDTMPTRQELQDLLQKIHAPKHSTLTGEMATLIDQCLELLRQFEAVSKANKTVGGELIKTVDTITALLDLAISASVAPSSEPNDNDGRDAKPAVFKSLRDLSRHIVASNRAEKATHQEAMPSIKTADKMEIPPDGATEKLRADPEYRRMIRWEEAQKAIRRELAIVETAADLVELGSNPLVAKVPDQERFAHAMRRLLWVYDTVGGNEAFRSLKDSIPD